MEVSKVHYLKTWPEHFRAVVNLNVRRRKTVEIRKNDRDYQIGDMLILQEYAPDLCVFTGARAIRMVSHILSGEPWLSEGYVALSITEL